MAEARVRLPSWSCERRVVFARKLQGTTPAAAQGAFWTETKHELAAHVTDLPESEVNVWQIKALYRETLSHKPTVQPRQKSRVLAVDAASGPRAQ